MPELSIRKMHGGGAQGGSGHRWEESSGKKFSRPFSRHAKCARQEGDDDGCQYVRKKGTPPSTHILLLLDDGVQAPLVSKDLCFEALWDNAYHVSCEMPVTE